MNNQSQIYILSGVYKEYNLEILSNMTITGMGNVTIDAQAKGRIFTVDDGLTVNIENLNLINGEGRNDIYIPYSGYQNGAGAIYVKESLVQMNNLTFVGNKAYQNGGAMKNYEGGYLYIEGCEFIANEAGGSSDGSYGGAVYSWASHMEIYSSTFSDNYAATKGGSVYASYGNSAGDFYCYISGCEFENSQALIGSTLFLESVVGEVSYNAFLDENNVIYTYRSKDKIDNNWWGTNNPDWSTLLEGTIKKPASYAVLNVLADSSTIATDSSTNIDYVFYWNGTANSENTSYIPNRFIELSSNGGKLKDIEGYLINGKFSTEFSSNETGTYEITAKVDNAQITIKINVEDKPVTPKENATISIYGTDVYEGQNATLTIDLPSDALGNVTVGNITSSLVNGTAYVVITGLPVGNTTLPIFYSGDEKYNPLESSVTITVKEKASAVIIAPDVVKYYHGPERFVVTITDGDGNPLANESVDIILNGVTYTKTTDANGTASLGLNLNSGNHTASVVFNNTTVNATVTILSTVEGNDLVKVFRNATPYTATFKDSEGNYLAKGTQVEYNINGVMYKKEVGENGVATLNINLAQGTYIITAINPVTGEKCANNITVLPRIVYNNDITKYYKNATPYTVKLIGDDGNPVGAGEVVRFNINGVFYDRVTNESGIAKLNINLAQGDYIITAEYKNCKVSNNIKVLPVLSANDLTKKFSTPDYFVVSLVDGQGNPYGGEIITFNVNGLFYNRITDGNGQAKLNINLPIGEYLITSSYNGANIANKITVTP